MRCLCSIFKRATLSYALRSSRRNNVADWNWTTAWPERQLEGGDAQKLAHTHREVLLRFFTQSPTRLHTEAFTQRSLCTEELLYTKAFPPRNCYTQKLLYKEVFTQHIDASTHRNFYTEKPLQRELVHMEAFTRIEIFVYRRAFTLRNFHTQKLSPREVFFNFADWFYKQTLLHGKAFAQRSFCTEAPWLEVKS